MSIITINCFENSNELFFEHSMKTYKLFRVLILYSIIKIMDNKFIICVVNVTNEIINLPKNIKLGVICLINLLNMIDTSPKKIISTLKMISNLISEMKIYQKTNSKLWETFYHIIAIH